MRRAFVIAITMIALAGCRTTNADNWTGGATTPFKQAERSCTDLAESIAEDADRRDFFVGCMGSLGWTPRPGAEINL